MLRRIGAAVLYFGVSMSVVAQAIVVALDGLSDKTAMFAIAIIGMAAVSSSGYGLSLWVARRHLRADAHLGGRRDAIAGALAIVLLLVASIATQGASAPLRAAFYLATGAAAALLAHFPWLQRAALGPQDERRRADA